MVELGSQLRAGAFEGQALGGSIRVRFDGLQHLMSVELDGTVMLPEAAGDRGRLADALLEAMQSAYDRSTTHSKVSAWNLHQRHPELLQAPLVQLGAGKTTLDPWLNVVRTEETMRLAEEIFLHFDADGDGYWNLMETSAAQLATEGTSMQHDAFEALIMAAAPNGGRDLQEDDLGRGLPLRQVVDLYTDARLQRRLGFVLDVRKDHRMIFGSDG